MTLRRMDTVMSVTYRRQKFHLAFTLLLIVCLVILGIQLVKFGTHQRNLEDSVLQLHASISTLNARVNLLEWRIDELTQQSFDGLTRDRQLLELQNVQTIMIESIIGE